MPAKCKIHNGYSGKMLPTIISYKTLEATPRDKEHSRNQNTLKLLVKLAQIQYYRHKFNIIDTRTTKNSIKFRR